MIKWSSILLFTIPFFNLLFVAGKKGCPWYIWELTIFPYHISNLVYPWAFTITTFFINGRCITNEHFLVTRWINWIFIANRFDACAVFWKFKFLPQITITCVKISSGFFWFTEAEYWHYCSVKVSTSWCYIGLWVFVVIVRAVRFLSAFRQWIFLYNSTFQELLTNLISYFSQISWTLWYDKDKSNWKKAWSKSVNLVELWAGSPT